MNMPDLDRLPLPSSDYQWYQTSAYPTPPPFAIPPDMNLLGFAPGGSPLPEYFQTGGTCPIIGRVGDHGPFVALNLQYFLDLLGSSQEKRGNPSPWGHCPYTTTGSTPPREPLFATEPIFPVETVNAVPQTPRKRARTTKACASCHDSRKTCGEERPCARCSQKNIPCEDRPRKRSRLSRVSSQEIANAQTVHMLEPSWSELVLGS